MTQADIDNLQNKAKLLGESENIAIICATGINRSKTKYAIIKNADNNYTVVIPDDAIYIGNIKTSIKSSFRDPKNLNNCNITIIGGGNLNSVSSMCALMQCNELDLTKLDMKTVISTSKMFEGSVIKSLKHNMIIDKLVDASDMFIASAIYNVNGSNIIADFSGIHAEFEDCSNMMYNCFLPKIVDIQNMKLKKSENTFKFYSEAKCIQLYVVNNDKELRDIICASRSPKVNIDKKMKIIPVDKYNQVKDAINHDNIDSILKEIAQ